MEHGFEKHLQNMERSFDDGPDFERVKVPKVFETCRNQKHWEEILTDGFCSVCQHKLSSKKN